MANVVYCDICREHDERTPATMAFHVVQVGHGDAPPPAVRCCTEHEGHAALMRRYLAPAAVYRISLTEDAGWESAS